VKKGLGQATLAFSGPTGRYAAHIRMQDENDGTSPFSLSVGGRTVYEGKLDFEDERPHWFSSPPFDVDAGDLVTLTVHPQGGERGRTESVVFTAAEAGSGAAVGRGQVVFSPTGLEERSADELAAMLNPKVRLPNPDKVFVNLLDAPDKGVQAVHLVNYDFRYKVMIPGLYATDDGDQEARTPLTNPQIMVRKQLRIERPEELVEPVLQVHGFATPKCTADLVVTVNGIPAGRIKNENKRQMWIEMPLDRSLLARENVIDLRAEGPLDNDRWWQVGIDTDTHAGGSFCSTDGGKTFTADDLSPDLKVQTGEYMIRVADRRPGAAGEDPKNLARNPGFETMTTPHGETELTVAPAERVEVVVKGKPRPCLALSPEAPPAWIEGEAKDGATVYTVPSVSIYTMLALADSRAALEPIFQAQTAASTWTIPPVTTPLRQVLADWQPFGNGFAIDAANPLGGKQVVRCENETASQKAGITQQFDLQQKEPKPIVITAWSRAENVSGKADSGYAIFADATCDDGTVMKALNAPFATGMRYWNQVTLKISPTKPIRVLNLYLLFRGHTGRAWFDNISVKIEE
jgi:hypothetical protein